MARRRGHGGVSRTAREPGRGKPAAPREVGRNGWRGPSGRRCRASTAQGRVYGCGSCAGCALKDSCFRPKDPGAVKTVAVNPTLRRFRERASFLLNTERGTKLRKRRSGGRAQPWAARASTAPWGRGPSAASLRGTGRRPCRSGTMGSGGAGGAPACFCHPRHPWGRGADGSADGLLGGWLPKGASPGGVTDDEARGAYDSLDRRPRKRLGWRCPWEVYHCQSLHLP